MSEPEKSWHDDVPFPKRWIAYVVIKVIVLAVAIVLALSWYGVL